MHHQQNQEPPAVRSARRPFQYTLGALFALMLAAALIAWWWQLDFKPKMVLLAVFLGAVVMPGAAILLALFCGRMTKNASQQINEFIEVERALPARLRGGIPGSSWLTGPWQTASTLIYVIVGSVAFGWHRMVVLAGVVLFMAARAGMELREWQRQGRLLLELEPLRRPANWRLAFLALGIAMTLAPLLGVSLLVSIGGVLIMGVSLQLLVQGMSNRVTERGLFIRGKFVRWDMLKSYYWTAEKNFVILPLAQSAGVGCTYLKIDARQREQVDELLQRYLPEAPFDAPGRHALDATIY